MTEQQSDCANYHVAPKALMKKDGKYLFLRSKTGRHFDLPGGRINKDEHSGFDWLSQEDVLIQKDKFFDSEEYLAFEQFFLKDRR